jgi:hypothetical protein
MKDIKLTKFRARTEILFKADKDDEWFIWIHHIEKKSGKKRSTMIIQKDMDDFLQGFIKDGWVIFDGIETKPVKKPKKPKVDKKK